MTEQLVLPKTIARGVWHQLYYLNGAVPLFAVASSGECVGTLYVNTQDDLRTGTAVLNRLLDEVDPQPKAALHTSYTVEEMERIGRAVLDGPAPKRRRARKGAASIEPAPPALQLVR